MKRLIAVILLWSIAAILETSLLVLPELLVGSYGRPLTPFSPQLVFVSIVLVAVCLCIDTFLVGGTGRWTGCVVALPMAIAGIVHILVRWLFPLSVPSYTGWPEIFHSLIVLAAALVVGDILRRFPGHAEPAKCLNCGYPRVGLSGRSCPECGRDFASATNSRLVAWKRQRRTATLVVFGVTIVSCAVVLGWELFLVLGST